jgi:glycine hydroxymethyltransferase
MKYFGEDYAKQIVRNAKAFAEALAAEGFKVVGEHLGYTKSHQVAIDVRNLGGGAKVAKMFEDANIITNKNLLPYDPPSAVKDPSGIRLGVQEMTRYGVKEEDMAEIAKFMREVAIDKKDVSEVKKKVIEFRKRFLTVKYTFDLDLGQFSNGKAIPLLI